MGSPVVDLGPVRLALYAVAAAAAAAVPAPIDFDLMPSAKPQDVAATWLRCRLEWDDRVALGAGSAAKIRSSGTLILSVMVAQATGASAAVSICQQLRAAFRPARLAGGVELLHGSSMVRVGREDGRYRWDVRIPWRYLLTSMRGTTTGGAAVTVATAIPIVQGLFRTEIEQALSLPTFYENGPSAEAPTPLPWALFTARLLQPVATEQGPNEIVPGRAIILLHTNAARGTAGVDSIADSICRTYQVRQVRGIQFSVPSVDRRGRTPAGTWQTNIRLPFQFEVPLP